MKKIALTLVASVAALAMASPASAGRVVKSYKFEAITPGEIRTPAGSFSFSYDDVTFAATLDAIDFSFPSPYNEIFTTENTDIVFLDTAFPTVVLGRKIFGVNAVCALCGFNDFILTFEQRYLAQGGFVGTFEYSVIGNGKAFRGLVQGLEVDAAVPEPATWALMLLGFGLVGGAMRRRPSGARMRVSYT